MKSFKALALAAGMTVLPLAAKAGTINFLDTFTGAASSHWMEDTGGWYVHDGVYDTHSPSNSPVTESSLDFDFLGTSLLTIDVDVNSLADGGIWISSNGAHTQGILLVLGGNGYGPNASHPNGDDLYWHVVTPSSIAGPYAEHDSVFTPNGDYHLTVTALNGVYKAYVNHNLVSTLTDSTYSHGRVGLYDEWGPMTFDNFQVSGAIAAVEPAGWALMIAGFGLAGSALRRRRSLAAA